jgi:hypothetical protein
MQRALSQNKLPVSNNVVDTEVCGPCPQGKAHQLSYPKFSSASTIPMELVFSDVCVGGRGGAPSPVAAKNIM